MLKKKDYILIFSFFLSFLLCFQEKNEASLLNYLTENNVACVCVRMDLGWGCYRCAVVVMVPIQPISAERTHSQRYRKRKTVFGCYLARKLKIARRCDRTIERPKFFVRFGRSAVIAQSQNHNRSIQWLWWPFFSVCHCCCCFHRQIRGPAVRKH